MNIGAATFMGYAYTNTNTKTTASKQRDTNNGTTFPTYPELWCRKYIQKRYDNG